MLVQKRKLAELEVGQFRQQARAVAKSLIHICIGEGDMVGIFSHNRPHWHIADIGICSPLGVKSALYSFDPDAKRAKTRLDPRLI
ncbi:MAG: hypothetical protein K9K62_05915 [Desulfobacteraceae bacterium]|nr:hypothetical protein [Desulfobacteraceae bacterium]